MTCRTYAVSAAQRMSAAIRNFIKSEDGNLTVTMSLSMIAMFLSIGSAIDYSRLLSTRTALSAATDAAALQVGNSRSTSQAALEDLAKAVIGRNYAEAKHGELIDIDLDVDQDKVKLVTRARFETTFMRLAGIYSIDIPIRSHVTRSGNNLEVSLVLDITGSMRGSKLTALKTAATNFINTVVWEEQDRFYSKVALVPYSMGVNVGSRATEMRGSVTSGTCNSPGCSSYRFRNARGANRTMSISSCVSERLGAHAYTDAPPSTAPVGRNYASPNNPCPTAQLMPLTSDRTALNAAIAGFSADGSTAGQIGVAWGWYSLSRDFGTWTGASRPAAYGTEHVNKIAVIMTDGDFNTGYCNGVIARDSGSGSGVADDKISCDATNGQTTDQALAMCAAMKAKGIIIYTVGFDVGTEADAVRVMNGCASEPGNVFIAPTSAQLLDAFATIGARVQALRLSL